MHIPTIIILALLLNAIAGFYLQVLYRRKRKHTCFHLWSLSCICFVLGAILATSRSYYISSVVSFFIADYLLFLAPVFILAGLIQFSRFRYTKLRRKQAKIGLITFALLLLLTHQHPALISLLTAIATALIFLLCALLLQKSVFTEPVFTRSLKTIFILHGLVMFTQACLIVLKWDTIDAVTLPEGTLFTLLSHIILTTLTALLLPWLCFLKLERKLTLKSQRDGLTKLANREYFFSQIERYWRNYPTLQSGLMMIDIDLFKSVNDNFGHAIGDRAIKSVAKVLSKQLRSNDIIGRIGGEEYAVLLVDVDTQTALNIAQRLCEQVAKQLQVVGGEPVALTISIGLVQLLPADHSHNEAYEAADAALYKSKRSGRNTVTMLAL